MRPASRLLPLMLLAATSAAQGDTTLPGRLFLTPEQRQAIDRERSSRQPAEGDTAAGDSPASGEITNSHGRRLIWTDEATGWREVAPSSAKPASSRRQK